MKNHILSLLFIALLIPGASFAQGGLEKLASLQGSWSGEGYQQRGQNERIDFRHEEEVSVLMEGKLIMFHGTGIGKSNDEKGFEAIGMMFFDVSASQTFIHAWTLDGRYTKALVDITDSGFTWGFEVNNGGKVQYEATITEDTWKETGSFSPDGTTWYPFMETSLTRN